MESANRIVADPQHVGQVCRWCNTPVALGHELALCTSCRAIHHAPCWDRSLGCSTQGCVNAPLATLPSQAPPQAAVAVMPTAAPGPQMAPGLKLCIRCRQAMPEYEELCPHCHMINTPDGLYHGPKENAPGAVGAFVLSLVSLFFCGIILGPLAYSMASKAKDKIDVNPRYGGAGLCTAAKTIGIIAAIFSGLYLLYVIGSKH